MTRPPVFVGVVGWKNSGKTTLIERLIPRLTARGLKVMTVKHTHHDLRPPDGATDGERHARAGALQTIVIAPDAWEIDDRRQAGPPPALAELGAHVASADVVLVEGFKSAPIPKIEVRRRACATQDVLALGDTRIVAIAADHSLAGVPDMPVFDLDDADGVAAFIVALAG